MSSDSSFAFTRVKSSRIASSFGEVPELSSEGMPFSRDLFSQLRKERIDKDSNDGLVTIDTHENRNQSATPFGFQFAVTPEPEFDESPDELSKLKYDSTSQVLVTKDLDAQAIFDVKAYLLCYRTTTVNQFGWDSDWQFFD